MLDGVGEAKRLGIALIHQELMLAPNLDIAANIFLGNERARPRHGWSAAAAARAEPARPSKLLARVGLDALPPTTPARTLTVGHDADGRDRAALSPDARIIDHGRADGVAVGRRVGAAVRR